MPFSAVFFDLDGTLIDSEAIGIEASLVACAKLGLAQDRAFFESLIGIDDATCRQRILDRFPSMDFEAHEMLFRAEVTRIETAELPKKPGVDEILQKISALGLPMAVVTSSRAIRAAWKLNRAGIADFFQTVVSADDVMAPKPAAEPYLLAATRLGVDPARCLVFEDSDPGSAAGQAAGMTVVQVPDIGQVMGASADLVAPSLLEGAMSIGLIASAA